MSARIVAATVLGLLLVLGLGWGIAEQEIRFPHREHANLFPVCTGCHQGIDTGEAAAIYPPEEVCDRCHEGGGAPEIAWDGPDSTPTNVRFSHADHQRYTGRAGEATRCTSCHFEAGDSAWMSVVRATPDRCIDCHAHRADDHLAETAECTACHAPLTGAGGLTREMIATFPKPASHDAPGFLLRHGASPAEVEARCAVCHARETCTRCHANAGSLPAIAALGSDPRVAALEAEKEPVYPVPASHTSEEWLVAHGAEAEEETDECANCHTAPSCGGCHLRADPAGVIASLPRPEREGLGVAGSRMTRAVHPIGFDVEHGSAAAAGQDRCSSCHAEAFCSGCHDAPDSPGFHPANYVMSHGTDSWASSTDCASCHNTEAFCRACHEESGLASKGRLDVAYHNAEPLWLLAHGEAARRDLESCTTCHRQNDCTRCHSSTGGWGVSPHGPGFEPEEMAEENRLTCSRCHVGDPLSRPR